MSRLDHSRARTQQRVNLDRHKETGPEARNRISAETHTIIDGMGRGKPEKVKRIDPNSPEGRAIAERALRGR